MVIGSTLNDVLAVSAPSKTELQDDEKASASAAKEPLSEQKVRGLCITPVKKLNLSHLVVVLNEMFWIVKKKKNDTLYHNGEFNA